jgi:hypothetical protein
MLKHQLWDRIIDGSIRSLVKSLKLLYSIKGEKINMAEGFFFFGLVHKGKDWCVNSTSCGKDRLKEWIYMYLGYRKVY